MIKKVLHLITDLHTGGTEIMLYKLISNMDRSKFNNVVVSMLDKGTLGEKIEQNNITIYTLGMKRGIPGIKPFRRLLRIIKYEKPDIIQTWLYHADLMGILAGRISGRIPVIWNLRCSNMDFSYYSRLSKLVVGTCARLSSWSKSIIVNSIAGQDFHQSKGYHPNKWIRIPNGFELDKYTPDETKRKQLRKELNIPLDAFVIGIVARNDPMKDLPGFIKAAHILSHMVSSKIDLRFLMVGSGIDYSNSNLIKLIQSEGMKKNLILLGERGDVPAIMASLDIFCSSSISEGFSNVIGEAMACGVPCVATDAGDSATIIGDTGLIVPPQNPVILAQSLKRMIDMNEEERQLMGLAARNRILKNYSLLKIIKEYETLYESIR